MCILEGNYAWQASRNPLCQQRGQQGTTNCPRFPFTKFRSLKKYSNALVYDLEIQQWCNEQPIFLFYDIFSACSFSNQIFQCHIKIPIHKWQVDFNFWNITMSLHISKMHCTNVQKLVVVLAMVIAAPGLFFEQTKQG